MQPAFFIEGEMGKQKQAEAKPVDVAAEVAASEPDKLPTVKRFRVQLSAHTPIEFNDLVIDAQNVAEAKAKFCEKNGILDSTCPWTITEVTE